MELYSEVAGEGPEIVLLHEGICDSRMWDPQWERWTRSHRVLRFDFRGYGRSPLEPGPFASARDALELMDRHGFERTAVIGVSSKRTPIASYTAFAIAGITGFSGPSPASFAPKGPSASTLSTTIASSAGVSSDVGIL